MYSISYINRNHTPILSWLTNNYAHKCDTKPPQLYNTLIVRVKCYFCNQSYKMIKKNVSFVDCAPAAANKHTRALTRIWIYYNSILYSSLHERHIKWWLSGGWVAARRVKYKRSARRERLSRLLSLFSSLGLSSQVSIKRFFISKIKIKSLIKYTRSSGRVKGLEKCCLKERCQLYTSLSSSLALYRRPVSFYNKKPTTLFIYAIREFWDAMVLPFRVCALSA